MREEGLFRITRLLVHDVLWFLIGPKRDRGKRVGDEVHPKEVDRDKGRGEAKARGDEHRNDFADIGGKQEEDGFLNVGVDTPALLDGFFDGGEVIVGEDHVGRAFGDVGAGDAHGDADIGSFKGGRVINAIAGHDLLFAFSDAKFPSNRKGGVLMVAGDHDGRDARFLKGHDRGFGRFARRVNHAGQADEDEVLFFGLVFIVVGQSEDAKGIRGHFARSGHDGFLIFFSDFADLATHEDAVAAL